MRNYNNHGYLVSAPHNLEPRFLFTASWINELQHSIMTANMAVQPISDAEFKNRVQGLIVEIVDY